MKLKKYIKNNSGFSLLELLISSTATLLIMGSILTIMVTYSKKSNDDQSQSRQIQESRFLLNVLSSDLKDAGSVISLANTGGFLSKTAYFMGVYPLNRNDYPDGIIIAAGDPEAVTTLAATIDPSSSDDISVESTAVNDTSNPWQAGDYGIIISSEGYYVFLVDSVDMTGNTITKRTEAAYYSGLLNSSGYTDTREGATTDGDSIIYPVRAPVIRLTNFSIYLIQEGYDTDLKRNRRDLIRVVDAVETSDVLNDDTAIKYVLAENVWDMQIGYRNYPDFPDTTTKVDFYLPTSTGSETNLELVQALQLKTVKEMIVNVVVLTENFLTQSENLELNVMALGDRSSYIIPDMGKVFNFKIYRLTVDIRNFNIIL